jgi:hypothetical protein
MPDPTLHGNHDPCPACELRREMQDTAPIAREVIPCNVCGGVCFLPLAGAALFSACWNAPIDRVAIENPIMHRHARERLPADLPAPQIVQPWWFGDPAFKGTGFYRRGLPELVPTRRLTPPAPGTEEHKAWSLVHRMPPGPDRGKERSRTFPGIAEAIADQWGGYAMEVAA